MITISHFNALKKRNHNYNALYVDDDDDPISVFLLHFFGISVVIKLHYFTNIFPVKMKHYARRRIYFHSQIVFIPGINAHLDPNIRF